MKYNLVISLVLLPPVLLIASFIKDSLSGTVSEPERTDKIVIRITMWGPDNEVNNVDKVNIKEFMEKNPHIDVRLERSTGNIDAKLATAAAIGGMPDIFMYGPGALQIYAEFGWIVDLLPFVESDREADRIDFNDFIDGTIESFMYKGKLYGLPKDFTPLVLYYNKRVFDKANVPYPPGSGWTWAQFVETARKLTKDTDNDGKIDQYGFQIQYHPIFWAPIVATNDGLTNSPKDGKCEGYLDSPQSLEALRLYTELQTVHKVSPTPLEEQMMGQWLFQTGRVGMLISGHWQMALFLEPKVKEFTLDSIGIASIPAIKRPATILGIAGWAITNQSRHKKEAYSLIKWITSERCLRRRATCHIAIMPRKSVAEEWANDKPLEQIFLAQCKIMKVPEFNFVPNGQIYNRISSKALEQVLLGATTVEEAFSNAARRIDSKSAR